ncbi:MAG: XdhC family protein [Stenomitos rutilans HA7619-LM2]|jgi:xanthine/CO dehydrogenase XdhC/CoxF family maturation factor|nr:XdhC family protein [Stenomitos rutilans HA7619-LM2]
MNDLQAILEAFQVTRQRGEPAFLVTVVQTQGSTYRRPGARMLITASDETIGMVSGGCLEQDILEHTRQMSGGEAIVVTYDSTTEDEDILWGFGLGCNGVVQVLVESLLPDACNPLTVLADCWRDRAPAVLASIFQAEASLSETSVKQGACLALTPDKLIVFDQHHADFITKIAADAQAVLHWQQSTLKSYDLATGTVQVFLEFVPSPTVLMIFGAGQDAIPVAQMAKSLGWQITVADCRANLASYDRFAVADQVVLTRRERLPQLYPLTDQLSAAVVMTHNYLDDLEVLRTVLPTAVPYVGILGPKRRTERLLQELQTTETYSNTQLAKLHAPIGLDIGAETPAAIAVSIVAEIQAVLAHRTSGFLKHSAMPIHQ